MGLEANNSCKEDKKFEELLNKRRKLASKNKNTVHKVSTSDSQLNDIIKNFNESKQYKKWIDSR